MLGVLLLLAAAYFWDLFHGDKIGIHGQLLRHYDRVLLDTYHKNGRKTPANPDVVVLGVDTASMRLDDLFPDEIEQIATLKAMKASWPWPRRVWAAVIDKLAAAGAKAIFFDFLFEGPAKDPEDDRLLKEAFLRHPGQVILGSKFFDEAVGNDPQDKKSGVLYPSMVDPVKAPPDCLAFVNFWPEADGVIRSGIFHLTPVEAERLANPDESAVANPTDREVPSVALALARHLKPDFDSPQFGRLRFSDPAAFEARSIHEIFIPDQWKNNFGDGEVFRDKVVLIGSTAPELHDVQDIPGAEIDGVKLHAHALSALLANSYIRPMPNAWIFVALLAGALLAWILVTFVRHPLVSVAAMWGLSAAVFQGCHWAFDHWNVEMSPLPAGYALNLCGVLGLAANPSTRQRFSA